MAFLNFNAANVNPNQKSFDPIPAGNYVAQIIQSEINPTKSGAGQILNLQFQILEGEFANRIIFINLNIQNPNAQAEQIAQQQLSAICHAVGVMQLQDTTQLHNKPMAIKVKIRKDGQYGDRNEISRFDALRQPAVAPQGYNPPPAAAPTTAAAVKPWNR